MKPNNLVSRLQQAVNRSAATRPHHWEDYTTSLFSFPGKYCIRKKCRTIWHPSRDEPIGCRGDDR